jgi:hypothetical protein
MTLEMVIVAVIDTVNVIHTVHLVMMIAIHLVDQRIMMAEKIHVHQIVLEFLECL